MSKKENPHGGDPGGLKAVLMVSEQYAKNNENAIKISYFENVKKAISSDEVFARTLLDRMRFGSWQRDIEKGHDILKNQGETAFKKYKKTLPCVTFSGTFAPSRLKENVVDPSGLLVGDLDDLADIDAVMTALSNDRYVYAAFRSPSWLGLKAIFKADGIIRNDADHKKFFAALERYLQTTYQLKLDPSGKDVCRLCYVSYDPEMFINNSCVSFPIEQWSHTHSQQRPGNDHHSSSDPRRRYAQKVLQTLCNNIRNANTEGSRHDIHLKNSRVIGGYISGGWLDESHALSELEQALHDSGIDNPKDRMKTILDGVKHGKASPLDPQDREYREKTSRKKTADGFKSADTIPLKRETPPAEPFPVGALPCDLAALINDAVSVVQCPPALVAGSLLSSISLVSQRFVDVSVDGRRCPASLYITSIALSGERKSTVDDLLTAPIQAFEKKEIEKYAAEYQRFQSDLFAFGKKRDAVVKAAGKNPDAISRGISELGDPPLSPPCRGIIIKDSTIEGLLKMLMSGASGVGMFISEGGLFLGGHSMRPEQKIKTISTLSLLWDGASIPISRAGENGFQYLCGKRVSVHLQVQPSLVGLIFDDPLMAGQGLFNRFLISWPETSIGDRPYQAMNIREYPSFKKYFRIISEALESNDCYKSGSDRELALKEMTLDPDAKKSFVAFYNDVEKSMRAGGALDQLTGYGSKIPENALRIAACLEFWGYRESTEITVDAMDAGIEIVKYYAGEMRRIGGVSTIEKSISDAETVLNWIRKRGGVFSLVCLQQKGPSFVRTKKAAVSTIETLEDHNLILKIDPQIIEGRNRRDCWKIVEA